MPRRQTVPPQPAAGAAPEQPPVKNTRRKTQAKSKQPKKKSAAATRGTPLSPVTRTPATQPPVQKLIPSAPSAQPMTAATPIDRQSKPATDCFVYGGVICLVGTVALGLLLGFVLLPPISALFERLRYSYAAPALSEDPAYLRLPSATETKKTLPQEQTYGFYGTLLSKDNDVLMVKELLPPLVLENKTQQQPASKTFIVRISDQTAYTYQRPQDDRNAAAPLFSPEEGSFDNLTKDVFIFVNTKDDPEETETINADHILYSEISPFAE